MNKKGELKKILIISIIAAAVILIIILITMYFSKSIFEKSPSSLSEKLSSLSEKSLANEQIINGTEIVMKEKETIKFNLDEKEHQITIDSTSEKFINITIQSSPIEAKINIGQSRRFDLDEDGEEDLFIQLNNISNGEVYIYLKKYIECAENWNCTEWGACLNKNQTRTCKDTNNCGTEIGKPNEIRECLLNCSQQNGKLCTKTQTCNGTIISASEGNCCAGNCTGIATGIEAGTCGTDIDCLITASETCSIANLTHSISTNNGTWIQTIKYYYRIRGFEDENCEFYREILGVTGGYTDSKKQELLNEGKTQEEIDEMEILTMEDIESDLAGKTSICRFSVYLLEERLQDVKDGKPFVTTEEASKCSGDFL